MNLNKIVSYSLFCLSICSLVEAQVMTALYIIPLLHSWGIAILMVMLLGFSIALAATLQHFQQARARTHNFTTCPLPRK